MTERAGLGRACWPYAAGVRILHLSWEYPPVVYGGLGRHVHAIAQTQAALGFDVTVITQAAAGASPDEVVNGVRVLRVSSDAPYVPLDEEHLLAWVAGFNSAVARAGIRLMRTWKPQVVHGHDWLVAHAAAVIKESARIPYVTTMHATEAGRHQGWLPSELSRSIHSIEWWSTYEARRVIACSEHMRWEVGQLFNPPLDKTVVIANGIDSGRWRVTARQRLIARAQYQTPLVVFTGRLEWEKGVHTLIDAMPRLRRQVAGVHLVIAGRGNADAQLREQVRAKRLGKAVTFSGWLPEEQLHALVAAADAVVVPSLYEPFGIVALEAASVGTPLVVARTGGLAELVEDGVTGRTFAPGNVVELASTLAQVLLDPPRAAASARAARTKVRSDFGWPAIAAQTVEVYQEAIADESRPQTIPVAKLAGLVGPPDPLPGNLLTGAVS